MENAEKAIMMAFAVFVLVIALSLAIYLFSKVTVTSEQLAFYSDSTIYYDNVEFDETGSIGKRYRRQDEIGTPLCITYDFDSEADGCVTIRDRDTMEQVRLPIAELKSYIEEKIQF